MFGFDEQVQGGEAAIGCFVGKDDGFAGACRRAGVDEVGEQALGGHDPGRAGAHDFHISGNGFGAVGNGGDGLGAARLIDLAYAGGAGGHEGGRINAAIGAGRRYDADVFNAGNAGGNAGHQD